MSPVPTQRRREPRLTPVDVISLMPDERTAVLVLLAGDPDPAVSDAVTAATRKILARTRVQPVIMQATGARAAGNL